jgi:uncharacterized protein (DUF2141 family)
LASIISASCANEIAPSGGKKDTEPPRAVLFYPQNQTVQFKYRNIKIKFNEYLENSTFSKTMISPPVAEKPKIRVNLKTIKIHLPEALDTNTTYSINFADDIRDLNESNPIKNFIYVFSTGSQIDTYSINGTVVDAYSAEPQENVIVMLHKEDSIDNVTKASPKYFSITDKSGNYSIRYIKPGAYALVALKDLNLNYIFDQVSEKIAFTHEKIYLNSDHPNQTKHLQLFGQNDPFIRILEAVQLFPGQIRVVFTAPVTSVKITGASVRAKNVSYLNETKDTLTIWHTNLQDKTDTLYFVINDTLFDTVRIKLKPIDQEKIINNKLNILLFDLKPEIEKNSSKALPSFHVSSVYESLKIFFSRPVSDINHSAQPIYLSKDTTREYKIIPKIHIDEKTKLFATLDFQKEENTNYFLTIPQGYFQDILGFANDSTRLHFQTDSKEKYGTLKLKVVAEKDHPRIIEIMDAAGNKKVEEIFLIEPAEKTFVFKNLSEGNYYIRVIEDENKNGEWDSGNFSQKKQPETIRYFRNLPALKGGWEAEFVLHVEGQQP